MRKTWIEFENNLFQTNDGVDTIDCEVLIVELKESPSGQGHEYVSIHCFSSLQVNYAK